MLAYRAEPTYLVATRRTPGRLRVGLLVRCSSISYRHSREYHRFIAPCCALGSCGCLHDCLPLTKKGRFPGNIHGKLASAVGGNDFAISFALKRPKARSIGVP